MPKAGQKLPRFPEGKTVLLPADVWNDTMEKLEKNFLLEIKGVQLIQTVSGLLGEVIKDPTDCPFGQFYRALVADVPHWFVRGGVVTGGTGNITVEDTDVGTVDPPPAENDRAWLQIAITGVTEDDVLLPGGNVTAVTIEHGSTIPDNVLPTAADPDGTLHLDLGEWSQGRWRSSGCGNFQISHCPGSLFYTRG